MTNIGIIGSDGRMGQALVRAIEAAGHASSGGVDKGGDVAGLADRSDVLVDFSAPAALETNLHAAIGAGIPLVIGTTGLGSTHHAAIDGAANSIAVLQTGNTSLGVTLLEHLVREAAARLGPEWDIEILEMHHRGKVDAPSGTALLLGEAAAEGRGIDLASHSERHTGAREPGAIGFASLRGGTVAGEHAVILAGERERITLAHSAEDRMIFAHGAVRAALWLLGRPAGRYRMAQVWGCDADDMNRDAIFEFFRLLAEDNPAPETELEFGNVYQLLVAVVLSAQATDAGVNKATRKLFARVKTPTQMVALGEDELKAHIKTIGLFNSKAKNVIALSEQLIAEHGGEVPRERDALVTLPGVGRKTANVVMNCAFGEETFAVDTHVFRVANRTGLAKGKTPEKVEALLEKRVPQPFRLHAHHWLILHGRYICKARLPECWRCPVVALCEYRNKVLERPVGKGRRAPSG